MSEVLSVFVQLAAGLVALAFAYPPVGAGAAALWWFGIGAARKLGVKPGVGGPALLPLALLVWLWKNRRDVREMLFFGGVSTAACLLTWAVVYSDVSGYTVAAFVSAALVAGGVWAFYYLEGRNPTPTNFRAARAQSLREWDTERTVAAVTDEAVKVSDVSAQGDAVAAVVTVAPGQSPSDLEGLLLERLGGTVHRLTGRPAVSVSVSRTATPGRFLVRVDTGHPLRKVVRWRDL